MAKKKRPPQPVEQTRKQAHISRRDRNAQRALLISTGAVGLIVIGVLIWGLVRVGILAPNQPVAVVNGESITARDFRKRLRLSYSIAQQSDTGTGSSQVDREAVGESTLDDMIQETLVRQEAERRGLTVTEAEVEDVIRESLGFQPLEETLSVATPAAVLPPTTPTVTPTFVYTLTPSLTLAPTPTSVLPLLTPIGASTSTLAASPTAAELDEEPAEATATPTVTPTRQPPTEEEEAAFRDAYQRRLDDWREIAGMSEADVRALFEYRTLFNKLIEDFAREVPDTVEKIRIGHILVETQQEAEALLARLDAGESFAELAAENSLDASTAYRGGDLGWASEDLLPVILPGVDTAEVFGLSIGEPGGPFETQQGYHLVMVYDRQEAVPLSPVEYLQKQQQEFQSFLADLRAESEENIEIDDNWQRFLSVLR